MSRRRAGTGNRPNHRRLIRPSDSRVADLGRAALFVAFGLALYAVVAGGLAAYDGRRRLHESARNALVGAFVATAVAAFVLLHAFHARDFTLHLRRRPLLAQAAVPVLLDRLLGRPGRLAAALAVRAHRARLARGHAQPRR